MKIIFTAILFCVFIISDVEACSCRNRKFEERCKGSDFILTGRVVSLLDSLSYKGWNNNFENQGYNVKVEVLKKYKGIYQKDTIQVTSERGGCGFLFSLNETYLIYGINKNQNVYTDHCLWTHLAERRKKDILRLDKKYKKDRI